MRTEFASTSAAVADAPRVIKSVIPNSSSANATFATKSEPRGNFTIEDFDEGAAEFFVLGLNEHGALGGRTEPPELALRNLKLNPYGGPVDVPFGALVRPVFISYAGSSAQANSSWQAAPASSTAPVEVFLESIALPTVEQLLESAALADGENVGAVETQLNEVLHWYGPAAIAAIHQFVFAAKTPLRVAATLIQALGLSRICRVEIQGVIERALRSNHVRLRYAALLAIGANMEPAMLPALNVAAGLESVGHLKADMERLIRLLAR